MPLHMTVLLAVLFVHMLGYANCKAVMVDSMDRKIGLLHRVERFTQDGAFRAERKLIITDEEDPNKISVNTQPKPGNDVLQGSEQGHKRCTGTRGRHPLGGTNGHRESQHIANKMRHLSHIRGKAGLLGRFKRFGTHDGGSRADDMPPSPIEADGSNFTSANTSSAHEKHSLTNPEQGWNDCTGTEDRQPIDGSNPNPGSNNSGRVKPHPLLNIMKESGQHVGSKLGHLLRKVVGKKIGLHKQGKARRQQRGMKIGHQKGRANL